MTAARAVLLLIDGASAPILRELLEAGDLPNLARHVVESGGIATGTTVFPSTTGVAYIPFLFGCFPGRLGVPGIRWFDRTEPVHGMRAQWRAARSYCGPQAGWINRDIAPAPSIFDLVPSLAICTPVTRGLPRGGHLMPFRRGLFGSIAHYTGDYTSLDGAVTRTWLAAASQAWRFLFVVYPGPDGITHHTNPRHARVLQSYRDIDAALGAFMARAVQHGEPPVIFAVADHGATVMREHRDIAVALESWGVPTLRHPAHVWRRGARAGVMVSGNASVQVYFEPRSGRERPRVFDELPGDVVDRLVSLDAVRLAACRDGDGGVLVFTHDGRARVRERDGRVEIETMAGDPLGLGESMVQEDHVVLAKSRLTDVPDAPRQLLQVFATARAGDLILAAHRDFDFRGPWEIPEHKSGHGSLIADHMEVPILASVPLPSAPIRTVDIMPAVLELLGIDVPDGLDGVPLSTLAAQEAGIT